MKQRRRIYYSAAQRSEIWDRWQAGEPMSSIGRRTGNLRAVQLLLGHTKIESTVRYLGIEVDDALAIAEQVDV